jgi:peroxiredoxin
MFGILIYSQSTAAAEKEEPKAKIGESAPDFALKDSYGKEFKLSDFKDKIVVLEWINQKCPVSHGHHDKQTMQKTYKKTADKVVWLAIDTGKTNSPENNRVYAAKMGLAYPVLHDTDGKVGRLYGAKSTPHMFVINKGGKLAYDGAIDDKGETNYVADAIEALIAGKNVPKSKTEPYGCGVHYP